MRDRREGGEQKSQQIEQWEENLLLYLWLFPGCWGYRAICGQISFPAKSTRELQIGKKEPYLVLTKGLK